MSRQKNPRSGKDRPSASNEQLKAAHDQLQASEQQLRAANQQLDAGNQQLRAANEQLAAEEAELRQAHDFLGRLIDYANAPIIVWDPKFRVTRFNGAFKRMTGYTADEVVGQELNILFPKASRNESLENIKHTLRGEYWESVEIPVLCKDGDIRVALWNSANVYAEDDTTLLATIAQGQDITERKRAQDELQVAHDQLQASEQQLRAANQQLDASNQQLGAANDQLRADEQEIKAANQQLRANEQQLKAANQQLRADEQQIKAANQQLRANEQQLKAANQQLRADVIERKKGEKKIKASLREKEVLLKEVHHRVKNNMQVISSILNLQSKHIEDEQALKMFKNGQSRIRSMAMVHEKLYESADLAGIDFAEYVQSTTSYLFSLHGVSGVVRLDIDIKDIFLDVSTAIPCGLIINELVSNSLKYAFGDGREGEILIKLYSDKAGKLTLVVEDDGIGFSKDVDFRKTESLGMQLVIMLVEQLGGAIELDRSKGTAFKITFERAGNSL